MATGRSGLGSAPAWDRTPAFGMVRRGYDPGQVLAHLNRVEEQMLVLEAKLRDAERERDETRRAKDIALESVEKSRNEPYENMAGRLADLMRTFDTEVAKLRSEADMESARLLGEAKSEAERIREQAQRVEEEALGRVEEIERKAREDAERIVMKARSEADQIDSELIAVYGSTMNELRSIRDRMQAAVREIDVVLDERADEPVVIHDEEGTGAPAAQLSPDAMGPSSAPGT